MAGWQSVPVHDPVVQDAAHHAVKTIQQRSNSLFPYELSEIIHANAEVRFSLIDWYHYYYCSISIRSLSEKDITNCNDDFKGFYA